MTSVVARSLRFSLLFAEREDVERVGTEGRLVRIVEVEFDVEVSAKLLALLLLFGREFVVKAMGVHGYAA